MTDENVVEQPAQEDQAAQTPQPLSSEQLYNMRMHLINSVNIEYKKFLSALTSLPFPESCFSTGFMFLDTGMLWVKEGISFAPFVNKVPAPVAAPAPEVQPEIKAEEAVA